MLPRSGHCLRGTPNWGTVPATQAVMKQATVPAINALKPLAAISFCFDGAMLARKKMKSVSIINTYRHKEDQSTSCPTKRGNSHPAV